MASINHQSRDGSTSLARAPAGSRSPARADRVSGPWSKTVTGESSELSPPVVSVVSPAVSPSPETSVDEQIMNASTDWSVSSVGSEYDSNAVKKPVWSKPLLNGVVEVVSPVMGAVCWPALGESAKAGMKSASSEESLHAVSDGSLVPALQATGNSSSLLHKPESVNVSPSSHVIHSGQRSVKRGGGSSGEYLSSNGGVLKSESFHGTVALDSKPKDLTHKESRRGRDGSQLNSGTGNDHHHQQSSYRRGNGGPYTRGRGQGQGHGRGNVEWNQNRNFNNRDTNMQSQRGGYRRGGYVSVHNSTPFIHPPMRLPVRPFGNNVMYPDVASVMVYFQGTPAPPMVPVPRYFPFPDPLHGTIVKQIEYYFSNENLVKDTYLRRNMDEQGWVPVNLIAGFKKVSCLTDNVQLILDVMRQSTNVEVQGDKMRRRNDWMRWLMPPAVQDSLASQLQGIGLDSRPSSGQLSSHLQQGGGERAAVA